MYAHAGLPSRNFLCLTPSARYTCVLSSRMAYPSSPSFDISIPWFTNTIGTAPSNPFLTTERTFIHAFAFPPTMSGFLHSIRPPAHIRRTNGSGGQKSASVPSGLRRSSGVRGWKKAKWWPNPNASEFCGLLYGCLVPSLVGKVTYKSDTRSVCRVSESVIHFFWLAHRSRAPVARPVNGEALTRHRRGTRDVHRSSGNIDDRGWAWLSRLTTLTRWPPSHSRNSSETWS